ncbi:flagellar hook-associated protein FlgL [Desulfurivibrio alkaliphilus]|uniref:Flagellin hook IN repeat protein n=1 Tax=Desulfurivibrio alkaliphilus (strain DSM 19089 / UNIQEM U267 / AHT2) TaxID=589865 RepID=D6Z722_DESAT|nr:flagellar hook-associated protein FlgL [Desulfurivibrio alkaliphilus]ADH87009.1 flagellin hook IN repeat protein [Desulfurivibrio alkaliphilus AHT 2]
MRVTMQSIYNNILTNLNKVNSDMNRINQQISSGKLMSKISDNPVNLVNALGLRTNLSEIGQYQRNINYGNTIISASETALTETKDLVMRAKTLAIQAANAPMTAENRENAAMEVKNLWEQAIILANSAVNGKHIFGGFRTIGYTPAEPTPFVKGAMDGYFVNGADPAPQGISGPLTSDQISGGTLTTDDLQINGQDLVTLLQEAEYPGLNGDDDLALNNPATLGLEMANADALAAALNEVGDITGVTASLTTLTAGAAANAEGGNGGETMLQSINGVNFAVVVPDGASAADVAELTVAAINNITELTGVAARVGDGDNGGALNSVVLYNLNPGDESDIEVGPLTNANANTGLAAGAYTVNNGNTGSISLSGAESFTITTSGAANDPPDDTILEMIGLHGGGWGFADLPDDGVLRYGPSLQEGDLLINGKPVTTAADEHSTIYADASAAAKAAAINGGNYGVTAEVTPASVIAGTAVNSGHAGVSRHIDFNGMDVEEGATYTLTINNQDFAYEAQVGDDLDAVIAGLATAVSADYPVAVDGTELTIVSGAGTGDITFAAADADGDKLAVKAVSIDQPHRTRLSENDLVINGISIFDEPATIQEGDADNTLIRAINAKTEETGVTAGRDQDGKLILTAVDGRNVHVQTSAQGHYATGFSGDQVHFGSVRLWSDQPFRLESGQVGEDDAAIDVGFAALGLSEPTGHDDRLEDGVMQVRTIHRDNDYVRYAGDRNNDIAIKVGQHSTIDISKNGFDAIYDTGVFSILKDLEQFLKGEGFRTATSAAQAGDIHATLGSGETGLELEERIQAGSFKVAVTDHHQVPPQERVITIQVDPANDTLNDIAQRLNGIPGLNAHWDDSGYLQLNSSDERYSFDLKEDTSGLLNATGLEFDNIQTSGLQKSIGDLEGLLNELTNQIADFGARANRMEVQNNIYMNLKLATAENLSELEDTDMIKAIMELKAKEVAYEAALSAAARTMQLSLVNFL